MGIVQRIRAALRPTPPITIIHKPSGKTTEVKQLLDFVPEMDRKTKEAIDRIREQMTANDTPYTGGYGNYRTIGEHFVGASSRDSNLAMLQALARWRGAKTVFEIGTAYGISGVAIAMTGVKLTTVECSQAQADLGAANIASAGVEAECLTERKEDAIPRFLDEGRRFDMVFHDGGHLGDAYVDDFAAIVPMLSPQAVFVIDNVFHDDRPKQREFTRTLSRRTCREGWEELLSNPLIEGALVYRGSVGIILMS